VLSFFSSRRNWNSPDSESSPAGECAPPPPPFDRGGGHTCLRKRGWGSPNSYVGTYTVVLYIYKYFVGLQLSKGLYLYSNIFTEAQKVQLYFFFNIFGWFKPIGKQHKIFDISLVLSSYFRPDTEVLITALSQIRQRLTVRWLYLRKSVTLH
jgi:hypothetical protein